MQQEPSLNVYDQPLIPCGMDPVTGFFRDGCCNTCMEDFGAHTVCIVVTRDFLQFSRFRGNDLSTPNPEFGFPGLRPGDHWCLCASRWKEAHDMGMAPKVVLQATHKRALELIPIELLKRFASDLN